MHEAAGSASGTVELRRDRDWEDVFADHWDALGAESKAALVDLLPDDWSWTGKRVLDFGCGPGRTLQEFRGEAREAEFWGVDIDAASIERVQRNLSPPFTGMRCAEDPPLGLEDGSFDLAWAISVFTHLTDNSLAWLLELHRLLKPGGLLIATYMGRWTSELMAGEPWDEDRVGMNVLRRNADRDEGTPMVLISDWWLRAHWGRAFEVLDIAPRIHNQSWALLRRRDVELTVEDLEAVADDPREHVAMRHNLRQVQREIDFYQQVVDKLRREHTAELAAVRSEYETSLSWALTRPLRRARARLAARRRTAG
jgi:SAM-dependent methyltransferase